MASSSGGNAAVANNVNVSRDVNRRRSTTDLRRSSVQLRGLKRKSFLQHQSSSEDMWSNNGHTSIGLLPGRKVVGPAFLLVASPIFVMTLIHVLKYSHGSIEDFWTDLRSGDDTIFMSIVSLMRPCSDPHVWKMIGIFVALQMVFMRLVPGNEFQGPTTPAGNIPRYKANGVQVYCLTMTLFVLGAKLDYFPGGVLYDNIELILSAMNIVALLFCLLLYVKGLCLPSTTDSGSSGSPIFDYYWGTELFPSILGWNVKHLTNCRIGMMFWALYPVSCAFKQMELYGTISSAMLVNVSLQLIYITKFYIWETGYLSTIDIMHDRAGFYIVWGVLVWLPCIYTSHSTYLVENSPDFNMLIPLMLFVVGVLCVYINYDADHQRQDFRARNGNVKVWGEDPYFIEAKYKTETGETKSSLLLGSGYWGLSRHFHYIPEIGASACWTLPVFTSKLLPYFYIPYLTVLLLDRAVRDDARCQAKYGAYWDRYCKRVNWLVIPQIF